MDNLENKNSETQAIIDLASKIQPVEIASRYNTRRVALPPGWKLEDRDDEKLMSIPARKKGTVTMHDADSFIEYINRHKEPEFTTIYCDADYRESKIDFKCIFNDHGRHVEESETQNWKDLTAKYTPEFSEEWDRWIEKNKVSLSQLSMALFIEENLQDIAAVDGYPTGQQLLEMATSFQANQDMRFKSAIRLQNGGVNMSFVNDDDNQTLAQMKLFEKIAIGIPVFWSGDAYQITARLRYRVKEGHLIFWYELIRNDKVLEDATKNMINKIKIATGVPFFFGTVS
jgi:uncharacterized protein YfdQ (DUF2303 family)